MSEVWASAFVALAAVALFVPAMVLTLVCLNVVQMLFDRLRGRDE